MIEEQTHTCHNPDMLRIQDALQANLDLAIEGNKPLFRTDANHLFDIYLDNITLTSDKDRKYHTCHACSKFFKKYGNLVTIADDGGLIPAIWPYDLVDNHYGYAFNKLRNVITKAKILSVFYATDETLGTRESGDWLHMFVKVPDFYKRRPDISLTPGQNMNKSGEYYRSLHKSVNLTSPSVLDQAIKIFKTNSVNMSDHFLRIVEIVRELQEKPHGATRNNFIWQAVATGPIGLFNVKSGVIGTLLQDIKDGMDFDSIKRRWNSKVNGRDYQRPKAAPTQGNIDAAEKLIEKLGIAKSLDRRYAKIEEVRLMWSPTDIPKKASGGVFSHLKAKNSDPVLNVSTPPQKVTWEKFEEKILPTAKQIRFKALNYGNYSGFLTAVDYDAPPILKWDNEEDRYPVSSYCYTKGSHCVTWNVAVGSLVTVTGIAKTPLPDGSYSSVMLILDGARDKSENQGNCLFPVILKSELHQVRSTIEAYSMYAKLTGREEATACGYGFSKGSKESIEVSVFDGTDWLNYIIDRWE
jgi:hypothetical protein